MDNKRRIKDTNVENFMKNVNELRKNGEFCDLAVKSNDGQIFLVHKIIVCSFSSFFKLVLNPNVLDEKPDIFRLHQHKEPEEPEEPGELEEPEELEEFDEFEEAEEPDVIELLKISSNILKKLIEYIYGEKVSARVKEIHDVLDGALFLGLDNLVNSCTLALIKTGNNFIPNCNEINDSIIEII